MGVAEERRRSGTHGAETAGRRRSRMDCACSPGGSDRAPGRLAAPIDECAAAAKAAEAPVVCACRMPANEAAAALSSSLAISIHLRADAPEAASPMTSKWRRGSWSAALLRSGLLPPMRTKTVTVRPSSHRRNRNNNAGAIALLLGAPRLPVVPAVASHTKLLRTGQSCIC